MANETNILNRDLIKADLFAPSIPQTFLDWFADRGWAPRPHQLELLCRLQEGESTLLIAPTGAGKTLAVDIKRNLETSIDEMGLPVTVETRTGDTLSHRRQRQKLVPPDILLTTPEQLALLIANKDADRFFLPICAM